MLESYYSRGCDSRELFSGLEISKSENFETYLNKYNTIHLDISSFADDYREDIVKAWYNGYLINGEHMYNPNSVTEAMHAGKLASYWKNTSAFDTINTFITLNFDGLKEDVIAMLNNERVDVDTETFQNDLSVISSKDDALTALIHLGYLAYDADEETACIPNYEVKNAFYAALKKDIRTRSCLWG